MVETAKIEHEENAMQKREVKKVTPFKRECKSCERKTTDEHETICIECGATTKEA